MPADIIARGMGSNAAIKSKQYTDTSIVGLANGFTYKGHKANIDALPTNAASGDLYTVEGKGPYAWNGSNWTSVALRGIDGKDGATGPRGPKGDPGPSTNSGVDIDDGYKITYFVRQEKPVTTLANTTWAACRLLSKDSINPEVNVDAIFTIYNKNDGSDIGYFNGHYSFDPNKNLTLCDEDGNYYIFAADNSELEKLNSIFPPEVQPEKINTLYRVGMGSNTKQEFGNIEDFYIKIYESGNAEADATLTNQANLDFFNSYCILIEELEVLNFEPTYYFFDIGTKLYDEVILLENGEPIQEIPAGSIGDKRLEIVEGGVITYKIYDDSIELITLTGFGPQYYTSGKEVIFPDINEVYNTPEYKSLGLDIMVHYSYDGNTIYEDNEGKYKKTFDTSGPIIIGIVGSSTPV